MIPYINEITNYSNIFPQPKILKQIDNRNLLIAPSPLSNPIKSYLNQNIKGVDNKLYFLPPRYYDYREETILNDRTEYPYIFYSYTLSIQYYCGFNVYFRDESYSESFINATLTISDGNNEFVVPIRSNQGGYIQLYDNIDKIDSGVRLSIKLTINNAQDPYDINHVIQFGICPVYEQQFGLKNFNSIVQLHSLPYDSPHGISVIKENVSVEYSYLPETDKSIHITLYQNHSDNNVIDKDLEVLNSYDGNFTYQGSVLSPNLVINDPLVLKSNYLEIEELKRYYYITDIETLGKDTFRVYLQVDTLMTYKEYIYNQGAYVLRNEYDYNNYIYDGKLPVLPIPKIVKQSSINNTQIFIGTNSSQNTTYVPSFLSDEVYKKIYNTTAYNYCFVISVCSTSIRFTNASGELLEYMNNNVNNMTTCNRVYITKGKDINNLYETLVNKFSVIDLFENKSQYIISVKYFPIKFDYLLDENDNKVDGIYIGKSNISTNISISEEISRVIDVMKLDNSACTRHHIADIIYNFKSAKYFLYQNLNCQLYLPYYGFTDIDSTLYYNEDNNGIQIKIYYNIDIISGGCTAELCNYKDIPMQIIEFDIGYDLDISKVDAANVKRNILLSGLKALSSLAIGGVNLGFDVADLKATQSRATKRTTSRSKLGREIAQEKRDIMRETISKNLNIASTFTIDTLSSNIDKIQCGGNMQNFNKYNLIDQMRTPFLYIKEVNYVDDEHYKHYMGLPLNEYRDLRYVRGYTEIGAIHLDNLDNALTQEKDEIEEYLKSGVYFPQKESGS